DILMMREFGEIEIEMAVEQIVFVLYAGDPRQALLLGALVQEGKIRAIGLSNETTWGIQKYLTLAEQKSLPRVASVQN
ncbi:aldo/keto reductase, partial [Rhizobium leguminosarum]|uniref:aldo/keto reductase n=1 Tax=Rhizobium leguminosarum TaxID=384 RepID=UPI003F9AC158